MSAVEHRTRQRTADAAAVVLWIVAIAGLIATVILEASVRDSGRRGLATDPSEVFVYGAALISASTVGLVVAIRRRQHPVGWLFLGLAVALSVGAVGDAYALDRAVIHGDHSAGPALALVAGQASFIAWFGLLAAILHLTPTGQPVGPRWRLAMIVTSVAAACGLAAKAVQDTPFDAPYSDIANPWALRSVGAAVDATAGIAIALTLVGLVLAGLSVVVRFRRATGD